MLNQTISEDMHLVEDNLKWDTRRNKQGAAADNAFPPLGDSQVVYSSLLVDTLLHVKVLEIRAHLYQRKNKI